MSKSSPSNDNSDDSNPPSPSDNPFIADSPFEEASPLLMIINYLLVWNSLELFLVFLIIFALNYKYFYKNLNKKIYN